MKFEQLAKENEGQQATDEDFGSALGLAFYLDQELIRWRKQSWKTRPATALEVVLWAQLRHAYGFETDGACNSKHLAQVVQALQP